MASSSTSTLSGTAGGANKKQSTTSTLKSSASTSSLIANKNSKSTESLKITKPTTTTTIAPQNNASNKCEDGENKTKQTLAADDELMEFERLEKYVEEHPSFRSSTSFVESIFPSSHNSSKKSPNYGAAASSSSSLADDSITHELAKMLKELQVSNPNNLKLNYMLSLIGANNSSSSSQRKLADLSEVDEKECDDDDAEAENNNENVNGDYDEKDSHMSSPSNNECIQKNYDSYGFEDEDESIMMQKLLGKSGSDESNKVVVLRKIKRIQQQKNGKANFYIFEFFFSNFY